MRVRSLLSTVGVGGVLALACAEAQAGKAAQDELIGKWRATAIERKGEKRPMPTALEMYAEFLPKGKFVSTIKDRHGTRTKRGTWKRLGPKKFKTVVGKRVDDVQYKLSDKTLTLTNPSTGQRLHMKRAD